MDGFRETRFSSIFHRNGPGARGAGSRSRQTQAAHGSGRLGRRADNYPSKVSAKGRVRHACLGGVAMPRASSLPEDSEFSRLRLARGTRAHACPQGHGRCGMPEKHRINSRPAHPCTNFCAGDRMAHQGPAQGAKRLQSTSAPRAAAAGRLRGRWLPRSLGMCVLAKMYYGLGGVGRRFRAVWLTLWCSPPHGGE